MPLKVGDILPSTEFLVMGPQGPQPLPSDSLLRKGKVVLFGLPGAFTGTCSTQHVPGFVAAAEALRARGVSRIVCLCVNDPHVTDAWAKATGGADAGIEFAADADSSFTRAIDMAFDAPGAGFYGRCLRFAALIEDGVASIVNIEPARGQVTTSSAQTLLEQIGG